MLIESVMVMGLALVAAPDGSTFAQQAGTIGEGRLAIETEAALSIAAPTTWRTGGAGNGAFGLGARYGVLDGLELGARGSYSSIRVACSWPFPCGENPGTQRTFSAEAVGRIRAFSALDDHLQVGVEASFGARFLRGDKTSNWGVDESLDDFVMQVPVSVSFELDALRSLLFLRTGPGVAVPLHIASGTFPIALSPYPVKTHGTELHLTTSLGVEHAIPLGSLVLAPFVSGTLDVLFGEGPRFHVSAGLSLIL